jgi:hypothetical protein
MIIHYYDATYDICQGRLERGRHLEIKLPVSGGEGGLACPPWLRVILSAAKDLSLERWILHPPLRLASNYPQKSIYEANFNNLLLLRLFIQKQSCTSSMRIR